MRWIIVFVGPSSGSGSGCFVLLLVAALLASMIPGFGDAAGVMIVVGLLVAILWLVGNSLATYDPTKTHSEVPKLPGPKFRSLRDWPIWLVISLLIGVRVGGALGTRSVDMSNMSLAVILFTAWCFFVYLQVAQAWHIGSFKVWSIARVGSLVTTGLIYVGISIAIGVLFINQGEWWGISMLIVPLFSTLILLLRSGIAD